MLWEYAVGGATPALGSIIKPLMAKPRNHLAKAPV
jgi:hypothetical protein